MGTTINQDFYHTVLVQVKLGFHIADWHVAVGLRQVRHGGRRDRLHEELVGALP